MIAFPLFLCSCRQFHSINPFFGSTVQTRLTAIMYNTIKLFLFYAPALVFSTIIPRHDSTPRIIAQFTASWTENIAVRSNGDILTTILLGPYVYSISPFSPPVLVANLTSTGKTSLLGITETTPDQFYVIAGNPNTSNITAGIGTLGVFSIDLVTGGFKNIANVPSATLLNGLATLSVSKNLLIASDSPSGQVFLIDVSTGVSSVLLADPTMKAPAGGILGVNGLRVMETGKDCEVWIYYANSSGELVCRLRFSVDEMKQVGAVEVLVNGTAVDDFAIDEKRGLLWLAGNQVDEILTVGLSGMLALLFRF